MNINHKVSRRSFLASAAVLAVGIGMGANANADAAKAIFRTDAQVAGASNHIGAEQFKSLNRSYDSATPEARWHRNSRRGWISAVALRNQRIAEYIIRESYSYRGWDTGEQWEALKKLWMKESSWNNKAVNHSSGAIGIPQLLPSQHSVPQGYRWDARVQIEWGLHYILHRYGSPAAAWEHERRHNWY